MLPFWPFIHDGLEVLAGQTLTPEQAVLTVVMLLVWTPLVFWLWLRHCPRLK